MINVKKKGNRNENDFANWLQKSGIKAYRNSSSGAGIYKGDVNNPLNLTIECKAVKKINLQKAWAQVNRDASIARNSPLLVVRFDSMPKDEWLIVQSSSDWIENILSSQTQANGNGSGAQSKSPFVTTEVKWDVQRMIEASKKVLKHFDI